MDSCNYTFGYDIGITSIGTCIIDQDNSKLVELSVRKFNQAKEAKESRLNRSQRRLLTRKKWRKNQLLAAFNDFNIISSSEIEANKNEYLRYYGVGQGISVPNFPTVYHLRQYALKNKISKREILLCIYNILHARGHFLLDAIDFTKDGLTYEIFKDKFYEFTEKFVVFIDNKNQFEEKVLHPLYSDSSKKTFGGLNGLKKIFKLNRFAKDEESESNLNNICLIITGAKANIGNLYGEIDEKTTSIELLKGNDELNEVQSTLVELSDILRISQILQDGCNYICDIAVRTIDKYSEAEKKHDELTINDFKKYGRSKNHIRSWRNLNNNYPNGLYVKEVKSILENQAIYYCEITPEFIEVCTSIVSARIPYYVGPLGDNSKNGWADKTNKIKYSYDYSIKHFNAVNEYETVKKWKENMVSHCTYLPDETALPKGSLLGEIFSIVNELNNLYCEDSDGNSYCLTKADKIKIFDELFFKKDYVTFSDVRNLLNLGKFTSRKQTSVRFNNRITVYKNIIKVLPELKLKSITEVFNSTDKLNKIEEIAMDINLFDDGKLKINHFKDPKYYGFDDATAQKLARINVTGFYRISRKFIFETAMNQYGDSVLTILFEDNNYETKNLQTIIFNACDMNGEIIDFTANKYEKILKDHNNELSIDLIIENGKPLLPISRPVVRALNETLKIYKECLKVYGVPKRVVIETAKGQDGIKDFNEDNGSTMAHYNKMPKLIDYLDRQLKEHDINKEILKGHIEDWKDIETYYEQNKLKVELYIRQNGIDLLTGKPIDITNLNDYEIDHILPRGFGDDSQDDKMLISKLANAKKGNRLPMEFLQDPDCRTITSMTVSVYEKIVSKLAEMKMISPIKQRYLLMVSQEEAESFINQNLVDTRYIISEFVSILKAYNKINNYSTHITCLNSKYTDIYRKALSFQKDRDLGDQHHAYDAACLCIADHCLNQYFPNYDLRKSAASSKYSGQSYSSYNEFVKDLKDNNDSSSEDKLRSFIRLAFYKAYRQQVYKLGKEAPLLQEIKERTPLISWKVEKNFDGQMFDATLKSPDKIKESEVLSILGINNNKRGFGSVNCVAVDFYKINHKYYAIHIPLVIVDKNGLINKEKYIKLIKEHYKATELLDKDGNVKTRAFRLRAYKNDIIYDSVTKSPHLFNIGSPANKVLEEKILNIYSYQDVYGFSKEITNALIQKFNLKTRKNRDGNEFSSISKTKMIDYLCENLCLANKEAHKKIMIDKTEKIINLHEFSNILAYYSLLSSDAMVGDDFTGRIRPTVNSHIKENEDAEYFKLKYSILGLRFNYNDQNKLIINGPNGYINGGYKKIKREEFSWYLSKI